MAYEIKVAIEKEIVADFMQNLAIWVAAEAHNIDARNMETRQYNDRLIAMQMRAFERKMARNQTYFEGL